MKRGQIKEVLQYCFPRAGHDIPDLSEDKIQLVREASMKTRQIRKVMRSKPTIEGAGVHLRRAFGYSEVPLFDPFLMLDDFRSERPELFVKGFPWHPHRGIETITYVLGGD